MEREDLKYKVVIDDSESPDTEVLARLAHLDMAVPAYMAAIARFPNRNVQLRQGAHVLKRHEGEPKPEPTKDPNLKSWSAYLIGGKKMQHLGYVEALTEAAAIDAAAVLFGISDIMRCG